MDIAKSERGAEGLNAVDARSERVTTIQHSTSTLTGMA